MIVPSLRSQADVLLRTPRLILSPVDFTDAGSVLALMEHPLVRNELEVELASPTRESLQQLPYYAARRLTDRQIIGGLGLHDDLVSFFVAPEYWGKGLGFEMVQHACRILAPAATWQSNSGSKVIARRLESCTPDPTAIPWLLLETVSSKGPGIFHRVTYIQRVNTTGGLAPTDPGSPFAEEHVPYTAEYYFYRATH